MSDYILNLIEALRAKGHDLPDGFATAPILDNWEFKACVDGYAAPSEKCRRALILVGRISGGDDRFPAGHIIHTSEVREVDGRPSIRWVRTRNTLYRLGAPALSVPLVTAAALAPDWTEALALLALMSGEHTLDEATLKTYTKLLDIVDSHDWSEKRLLARALAAAMDNAARFALRDAWMLLGADPREQVLAKGICGLLLGPVYGVNGNELDNADAVLVAWEAFASGDVSALGERNDHIAAAHEIGRSLVGEALWRGGSVRRLRAIVERILAYREANPRH